MKLETTEIEMGINKQNIIAGPVNNLDNIFIVSKEKMVKMMTFDGKEIHHKFLGKKEFQITSIYVDDLYFYCGFIDGTMEIIDIHNELSTIKITSDTDPGGPGNSRILEIYSSESYIFVRTLENGILIYDKFTLEFFKWIMIDTAFTILKASSYKRELFFVLTSENHVHVLDFDLEQLIPLNIKIDNYIDMEFDGRYLIMATKNRIKIHNPSKNFKIILKYKLEDNEIYKISILGQYLILATNGNTIIEINLTKMEAEPEQNIRSTKIIEKIKRDFFLQNKDIKSLEPDFPICWSDNNQNYLSFVKL